MVILGRYELDLSKPPLGTGAMGVVYRAVDLNLDRRPVALKTVLDIANPTVLELFEREWKALASIHHENIVRISDQGRFEERGVSRPFIVMEFLDGVTLAKLIRESSSRLTIENTLNYVYGICDGLERVHNGNLVHRDVKPSNIFITKDGKVKIIDFGLAHLMQGKDGTSTKGTRLYMAPEQLEGKEPTPLSDLFSLGVVTYEALTRQRPFNGTEDEVRHAIIHETPLPACQINPNISPLISCVIHKALAKKDQQRFPNIRVFAETLRKAQDGGPIEIFNPSGMRDRLDRARNYFDNGELELSSKTLGAIEAEGYFDEDIKLLRGQIKLRQLQREVNQSLEMARAHMAAGDHHLALEAVQAALEKDPQNVEALALLRAIESQSTEIKAEKWYQLAEQHYENRLYDKAMEAVQQVLKLQQKNERALDLRVKIERAEREDASIRNQRRLYYEQAFEALQRGDVDSAFSRMESLFRVGQLSQDKKLHDSDSRYEKFFNQVRTAQEEIARAYNEGRRHLAEQNYRETIRICAELLERYPGNAQFKALRVDAEDQEQRDLSAYFAEIGQRLEAEPDLDKKVNILEEAINRYPQEAHFRNKLNTARSRRDMARSINDQKAAFEKQGNFTGALSQLKALQQLHPRFPGIEREMERLEQRLKDQREEERKADWERQIQQEIDAGDWQRAGELLHKAQEEFAEDAGLRAMEGVIAKARNRVEQAFQLLADAGALIDKGSIDLGVDALRRARELNARDTRFLAQLSSLCLEGAEEIFEQDWKSAERLVDVALECDPASHSARDLKNRLHERKRRGIVDVCLTQARAFELEDRIEEALRVVEQGLEPYPDEIRLQQLQERYFRLRPELAPKPAHLEAQPSNSAAGGSEPIQPVEPPQSWVEPSITTETDPVRPVPQAKDRLAPLKDIARKGKDFVQRVEDAFRSLTPLTQKMVLGGVGLVVAGLMIWTGVHIWGNKAQTLKLAVVSVRNAETNEYHIIDNTGADVTANLRDGLAAGSYELKASKQGFQLFNLKFKIDPLTEPQKTLDVTWQPLPVERVVDVIIKLTPSVGALIGSLKVDDKDQTLEGSSELTIKWQSGAHSIRWEGLEGDFVEAKFEVDNDIVKFEKPASRGFVQGMVAARSKGKVNYWAVQAYKGVQKTVDGQSEKVDNNGSIVVEDGKPVSFKTGSTTLGDLPAAQPDRSVVYVYLAPLARTSGRGSQSGGGSQAEPDPQPPPLQTVPAGPTEEELRLRREQEKRRIREELDGPSSQKQ